MSKLTKYKFSDLYEMSSGISSSKEQAGHGSPFISFSTVFNNYFLPEELPDLMDTSLKEQEIFSVKKDDVFITRTSETVDALAMSCVAVKDYPKATFSGFVKRLRPKTTGIVYSKYIAFFLRSKYFRKVLDCNTIMTLRASFNEDMFSFLYLYLPDYEEQVRIGDLLYKMEMKIRTNNKINDNLEQQAKLIYDYWFTQFDFPDENGKPYCSSGGKMVWNEQLKRNIPENWKVAQLKDIFNVSGKPISRDDCQTDAYYTPIDVIPKRTITFAGGLSAAEANSSLQVYEENNILLGAMRVYFHRVCISAQSGITRTTTLVLKPKVDEYLGYAYQVLNDDNAILYATQHSSGTQQPYIKWNDVLENYRFAMPSNPKLLYEYSKISEPLITKAKNCARETEQLRKLRDWLLPMLMNGQATIND